MRMLFFYFRIYSHGFFYEIGSFSMISSFLNIFEVSIHILTKGAYLSQKKRNSQLVAYIQKLVND